MQDPQPDRSPILVTGVPRSGTTWLARLLATCRGTALVGREPMNPHQGQYRLGGSVTGWSRITHPTARQRRLLTRTYKGRNPWTYGRYGHRQWAAPLPWTRVVIKDPFALLSVPAIQRTTGATVVVVYRHPAAVLASYRRMGWRPDTREVADLLPVAPQPLKEPPVECSDALAGQARATSMAAFWQVLHRMALGPMRANDRVITVSHEELSVGGVGAARRLVEELGLEADPHRIEQLMRPRRPKEVDEHRLHNLSRSSAEASQQWRTRVPAHELDQIEEQTQDVRSELNKLRLRLNGGPYRGI